MVVFLYIKVIFRKIYGSGGVVYIGVCLFACSPGGRVSFFPSENDFLFLEKGAVLRNGGQQAIFFGLLSLF